MNMDNEIDILLEGIILNESIGPRFTKLINSLMEFNENKIKTAGYFKRQCKYVVILEKERAKISPEAMQRINMSCDETAELKALKHWTPEKLKQLRIKYAKEGLSKPDAYKYKTELEEFAK